jgi:putative flippase GtrA
MTSERNYRLLAREAARFGAVGGLGVVVTDGGTNLLREAGGLGWLPASVIATVAAIAVTFVGSRYWTFRHRLRTGLPRETVLFFALAGVGLLIQLGCLGFTVHVLGDTGRLAGNVGLFAGIVLATVFRFWAYRRWVWRQADREPADREPADREPADMKKRDSVCGQDMRGQRGGECDRAGGRQPVRT